MTTKYTQIDVWWCEQCKQEWKCPSVPHRPMCPKCGNTGFWRRFLTSAEAAAQASK